MSVMSSLRRSVYGIEKRPRVAKSKFAFYRSEREKRGDIQRRAGVMFIREMQKKEDRKA